MVADLVTPEDYAAILNLMGAYQHLVDAGDEDGWADLFTEDGAFIGLPGAPPEGYVGREGLKAIPRLNLAQAGGRFRHNLSSFTARYGDTHEEAFARYYMIGTVSPPGAGTSVVMQVDVATHLVRIDGAWKIKTNTMTAL
jgi:uncharacterized protein (TIGR02246 family)